MASNSRRLLVIAINLCFFKEYQQAGFNFTKCKFSQFGGDYIGTIAVTKSGIRCQMWTGIEQIHKTKRFPNDNFPEHSRERAKNYCRNPDGDNGGPWCYVDGVYENIVNKEYCDVPLSDDRDCLVYTRSMDSYSTITKLDYSLQNITVWIKLWNPTFNYRVKN
ncbi:hypothetical protein G9C98_002725 [Cotesia typhae]|uniref:Kringle domain-containing protein n=1 Tax=Cotesia typhae TaxID=2053667 RepID=A0A8J5UTH6_9HYME|nr:hypothetical protein G9C98_002725 [Cotesia typhae]